MILLSDALSFFRNSPQFRQMRALIQQDPSLLARMLQDIGQANPRLFQVNREDINVEILLDDIVTIIFAQ